MSAIINGGGGGGGSFTTLTGGTNTGNAFILGNGSSISTTGTGTIGAAGSNTQVQFNSAGVLAGTSALTVVSGVLSINGNTQTAAGISIGDNAGGGARIFLGGNDVVLSTFGGGYVNIGNGSSVALKLSEVNNPTLAAGASGFTVFAPDSVTHTLSYNSANLGISSLTGAWVNTNVTPVTVNANVATDQNLMSASVPAGTLNRVNRSLRVWLSGVYSTPAASTTAVVVKVKLGALTLATWTSTALAGIQATNDQFSVSALFTVQTAGATAALEGHGNLVIDLGVGNTVADSTFADVNTTTVSSVDLTAAQTLQITIAFTVASGSNTATQRQMVIETIN